MSDVIQRIEEQKNRNMYLARLGEAVENSLKTMTKRFSSTICKDVPPALTPEYCGDYCQWLDVCRLRGGAK